MENAINVKYRIRSIEDERYSNDFKDVDLSTIDENNLAFQYRIETNINLAEDVIVVKPGIRYLYESNLVFQGSADFVFSVQNLRSIIKIDQEKMQVDISVDILPTLLSVSYSTLRGLIHAKLAGTPLASFPIPLIEMKNLISKNGLTVKE